MVEPGPVIISAAFAHCSQETTKVRPNLPEEEVNMGMMVLARKRSMRWQRGKIVDIVTRGKTKCLACPPVSTGFSNFTKGNRCSTLSAQCQLPLSLVA